MKTHEILFQTLSQADDYVNGEQLAKELGGVADFGEVRLP